MSGAEVSMLQCVKNSFRALGRWNCCQVTCRWSASAKCFHVL